VRSSSAGQATQQRLQASWRTAAAALHTRRDIHRASNPKLGHIPLATLTGFLYVLHALVYYEFSRSETIDFVDIRSQMKEWIRATTRGQAGLLEPLARRSEIER
jgi:hypothetical protein